MRYSQVISVVREEGKIVTTFSPILSASGIELNLQAGEPYIFFSNSNPERDKPLPIFRAEPAEKEKQILEKIQSFSNILAVR